MSGACNGYEVEIYDRPVNDSFSLPLPLSIARCMDNGIQEEFKWRFFTIELWDKQYLINVKNK